MDGSPFRVLPGMRKGIRPLVERSLIPSDITDCGRIDLNVKSLDTRASREVIGQMFEYAANGHYYWSKEDIEKFAQSTAEKQGVPLDEALQGLQPENDETADEFFIRVQENLREGQLRIVFFLEEAPSELKSVVDFLNKQMERSEVLLVEARQFSLDGVSVVAPTLFGFTEEARKVKRRVQVSTGIPSRRFKWDETSFFQDAGDRLEPGDLSIIRQLFDFCRSSSFEITFGTGAKRGSFQIKKSPILPRSLISVFSDGKLQLPFGWIKDNDFAVEVRDFLKDCAESRLSLQIPIDYSQKYPEYNFINWKGKLMELISVITEIEEMLETEISGNE